MLTKLSAWAAVLAFSAGPCFAQNKPAFEIDANGVVHIEKLVVENIDAINVDAKIVRADDIFATTVQTELVDFKNDRGQNWNISVRNYVDNVTALRVKHSVNSNHYDFMGNTARVRFNESDWVSTKVYDVREYSKASDARLKHDVLPLDLRDFSALAPVTYSLNDPELVPEGEKRQIGFIADDVEKIYPELVYRGDDDYRRLRYGQLTAVLTAALHETRADLAATQAALAEERARLLRLEERLSALEARVPTLAAAEN